MIEVGFNYSMKKAVEPDLSPNCSSHSRPMIKKIFIAVLTFHLAACVSTDAKFARFGEYVVGKEGVDVVVDSLFFSDLSGETKGFNRELNVAAQELIIASAIETLKLNGFEPRIVGTGHGLIYEPDAKREYTFSSQWKSTEKDLSFPVDADSDLPWTSEEARTYLKKVVELGREESKLRKNDKGRRQLVGSVSTAQDFYTPQLVKELESGLLIFISSEGTVRSNSKNLARNASVMLISGLLTGGTLIAGSSGEVSELTITAIDINSSQIVWQTQRTVEGAWTVDGTTAVATGVRSSFERYPLISGRYLTRNEREDRKKQRLKERRELPKEQDEN